MDFVIQYNMLRNDSLLAIKEAVAELPHQFVGVIPFSHEITSIDPIVGLRHIPYGSTTFVEIAHGIGWKGLSFDPETFNYKAWNTNRDDMLNCNNTVLTAWDMIGHLKNREDGDRIFMRPVLDLKQFSGHVSTVKEAIDFLTGALLAKSTVSTRLTPHSLVMVNQPHELVAEWRWFIVGGRVIDGSRYRKHGEPSKKHMQDESLYGLIQSLADKWLPSACCVMDTCLLENGETKIVEFNCINGSGFYDHDIKKIMTAWWRWHNDNDR